MEERSEFYSSLLQDVVQMLGKERDFIANCANVSALLFQRWNDFGIRVNWCGFYFLRSESTLVLGPFQGKVACTRIKMGRGVCGHVVRTKEPIAVENVCNFPSHIACDPESKSECVIPIVSTVGSLIGVLDCDSPNIGTFTSEDTLWLSRICVVLIESSDKL